MRLSKLLSIMLFSFVTSAEPVVVRVVDAASINATPQNAYFLAALQLALDKSQAKYGEYWLEPINVPINQLRQFKELDKGTIDVFWTVATTKRNAKAMTVPIPLAFGSFGIRALAINSDAQEDLATASLAELKRYRVLLGKDWPDVRVFENAGFEVENYGNIKAMYRLLGQSPGYIYPRGLIEILPELRIVNEKMLAYCLSICSFTQP